MRTFTTIDGKRLALDLVTVRAVLEKDRGIQLITSDDTYMVKTDFLDIVEEVERAKEGTF